MSNSFLLDKVPLMKTFYLSVVDFAQPSPIQGSIDSYGGFSTVAPRGLELHQQLQRSFSSDFPTYHSEVSIVNRFKRKGITIQIAGRIDGLYEEAEGEIVLEEIKSTLNLQSLTQSLEDSSFTHPYWLQLQTYGYFYWLKNKKIPRLRLLVVSLRTKQRMLLSLTLDIKAYEDWLEKRLTELLRQIDEAKKRISRRQKNANQLTFPFEKPRRFQQALIDAVTISLKKDESLLVQAPTGLGKTLAVLLPVLKEALGRGQKAIYVTPKNSQHQEVNLAVTQLQKKQNLFKTLFLSSKKKLCLKEEPFCNSRYCEYAKDHFTKVETHRLLKKSCRKTHLDSQYFQKIGKKYIVCPYELQMQSLENVDLIVGDYNYVFSPHLKNGRVTSVSFGETDKPNLIIDEAHNLPSRGLDYYSSTLSASFFLGLADQINGFEQVTQAIIKRPLHACLSMVNQYITSTLISPKCINPPLNAFQKQLEALNRAISEYLEADILIEKNDPLLSLYQYWADFTTALEIMQEPEINESFFAWVDPTKRQLKITCCNASHFLKQSYLNFANIVGFSATLKPFNYYAELTGLENADTIELSTPFQTNQRKLLFIPQVSTQYNLRQHHQAKLIEVIQRITQIHPGNYLVFFPSFDYLELIFNHFPKNENFTCLRQTRGMLDKDVKMLLTQLEAHDKAHLLFAVQGGVLSEGINYVGHLAIGAFIVGPPLPMFSWERLQIQRYYQKNYQAGIEYAAIYPAMAKVIQAAGRIIRSEKDKGLIVLLDCRFLEKKYADCMPKDWYENHPNEKVSTTILADIEAFWQTEPTEEAVSYDTD